LKHVSFFSGECDHLHAVYLMIAERALRYSYLRCACRGGLTSHCLPLETLIVSSWRPLYCQENSVWSTHVNSETRPLLNICEHKFQKPWHCFQTCPPCHPPPAISARVLLDASLICVCLIHTLVVQGLLLQAALACDPCNVKCIYPIAE
jgi:hypothetical protein